MEGRGRPEQIWRGRLHLGDEPGIYGDAAYAGLGVELPVTIREFGENPPDTGTFSIITQGARRYEGYPGHRVEVVAYEEDTDLPGRYRERVVAGETLVPRAGESGASETRVEVDLAAVVPREGGPRYVGVRVRLDTTMPPALYDDIVLLGLSLRSTRYYASFGFL